MSSHINSLSPPGAYGSQLNDEDSKSAVHSDASYLVLPTVSELNNLKEELRLTRETISELLSQYPPHVCVSAVL